MLIRFFLASTFLAVGTTTVLAQPDSSLTQYGIIDTWQERNQSDTLPITSGASTLPKTAIAKTPSTLGGSTTNQNQTGAYVPPGGVTNPASPVNQANSTSATGPLVRLANGQYIPASEVKPWMKLWKDKKAATTSAAVK